MLNKTIRALGLVVMATLIFTLPHLPQQWPLTLVMPALLARDRGPAGLRHGFKKLHALPLPGGASVGAVARRGFMPGFSCPLI